MSTQEGGGDLDVEKEMHKESWVIYGWRVYIERERERIVLLLLQERGR